MQILYLVVFEPEAKELVSLVIAKSSSRNFRHTFFACLCILSGYGSSLKDELCSIEFYTYMRV